LTFSGLHGVTFQKTELFKGSFCAIKRKNGRKETKKRGQKVRRKEKERPEEKEGKKINRK
jgi:hypothetical protein